MKDELEACLTKLGGWVLGVHNPKKEGKKRVIKSARSINIYCVRPTGSIVIH